MTREKREDRRKAEIRRQVAATVGQVKRMQAGQRAARQRKGAEGA